MVDSPKMPMLQLDLQKIVTFVERPFKLTQGDKGYIQPFRLSNGWSPYTVTADKLCFSGTKPDGTIIQIENEPNRFSTSEGVWYFTLPDETAQAIGQFDAYFYIKDGSNVVASTTKFSYDVGAKFGEDEASNSYVTAFEKLRNDLIGVVTGSREQLNGLTNLSNSAKTNVNSLLDTLQTQVTNFINQKTSEVNSTVSEKTTQLTNLSSQYQTKYNDLVASWNNQINGIKQAWATQTGTVANEWTAKKDSVANEWTSKKDQIDHDYSSKIQDLTSNYNQQFTNFLNEKKNLADQQRTQLQTDITEFKNGITSQLTTATNTITDINNNQIPALKQTLADVNSKIGHIDFNSYVKSVNGVRPDSNGNAQIPVSWNNLADKPFYFLNQARQDATWSGMGIDNPGENLHIFKVDIPHNNTVNLLGDNDSLIAFGSGDTKGMLEIAYSNHSARILGGNGNAPVWHEDIAWKSDLNKNIDFPTNITDFNDLPNGQYNCRKLTDQQWNAIINKPNTDKYGLLLSFKNDTDGWQIMFKTSDPNHISYRGTSGSRWGNWMNLVTDVDLANTGKVKTVNGIQPDAGGNITISGLTKSVKINGRIYMLDASGNLTFPSILSQINVVKGYNFGTNQPMNAASGQTISSDGHNSGWLVDGNALQPFAAEINNLTGRIDALEHQPARGITDVDGTHHDVKFLSQSDYNALSTKDPNTLYITPES